MGLRTRMICLLGASGLLLFTASVPGHAQTSSTYLTFARSLLLEGEYYRAVTEYKRALFFADSLDQDTRASAMLGVGEAYFAGGEFDRSGEWLNNSMPALRASGHSDEATVMMCRAFLKAGDGRRLLSILDQRNDATQYYGALALANCGEWSKAHEQLSGIPESSSYSSIARGQVPIALEGANANWKSPTTAALLGIVPGLGYAYSGHTQTAIAAFLVDSIFFWATYEAFDSDQNVLGGFLAVFSLAWYGGSIYGSAQAATRHNHYVQDATFAKFQY